MPRALFLLCLLLAGLPVQAEQRHYDDSGRYVGRQDQDGRHYDDSGRYQGRTDPDGRHYDASGRYDGRSDD